MRITIRIDDDLLGQLRRQANSERASLTDVLNRAIRRGIEAAQPKPAPFKQKTFAMGVPLVNLDKVLALADQWDDEVAIEKMRSCD